MDFVEVYAISLGSIFAIFIGWHLAARSAILRRRLWNVYRHRIMYTTLVIRQSGSSDYTLALALQLLLLVSLNAVACTIGVGDLAGISARAASLAAINTVPLYLGGRTSLLADSIFGIDLPYYIVMHGWIGRLCLAEALVHGVLSASKKHWNMELRQILLLSGTIALLVGSILYFRRLFYELFLKLHLFLALSFLVLLWLHITIGRNLATYCLGLSSALWSGQTVAWLWRLLCANVGHDQIEACHVKPFGAGSAETIELIIHVRRPWIVRAGQYVYITEPTVPHLFLGALQAHPYMIAWSDKDASGNNASRLISLLVERRRGFSAMLPYSRKLNITLDGPYGRGAPLGHYDKVLFLASGVGIATHLLHIRELLQAHKLKTAQARRLCLIWVIDNKDQEVWATLGLGTTRNQLEELIDLDDCFDRRILAIHIFSRDANAPGIDSKRPRIARWAYTSEEIGHYIKEEWRADAGSMAISSCATPDIEACVRQALKERCSLDWDITLYTSSFRIEGGNEAVRVRRASYGVETNF